MIDVVVADDQEIFRVGMTEILARAEDVRILGQPQSSEELLSALKTSTPDVLVLSTGFVPAFGKIQRLLQGRKIALVMLAEVAYARWLRAQAVVHRSMEGPGIVEALRRVARGELFVQSRSSDVRKDQSKPTRSRGN